MTATADSRKTLSLFGLMFIALTVFVYFFGLSVPLLGPDEPRYAQVAREMFERGDWVTPTLGGFDWFEKPALLYWMQIAAYHLFGVTEFAARFGSALFGLGTIAAVYLFARRMPENDRQTNTFAGLTAMIAATSLGLIVFSRGASFDIVLTFPVTAALVSFYIADSRRRDGLSDSLPLVLFYAFTGLALLAKGLVGMIFPLMIAAAFFVAVWRRPSAKVLLSPLWGIPLCIAVASLWYLPMYWQNGWKFIDEFFIQHHFQRYTSNKYLHPQPFYFFLWVLPLMTIPWIPFLFTELWQIVRSSISSAKEAGGPASPLSPAVRFCLLWAGIPLAFFSFSGSKLPGYILPALPPLIVLASLGVSRFLAKGGKRFNAIRTVAVSTFVVIVAALIFAVPHFARIDSVKSLFAAAAERGYTNEQVAMLHRVSHNAEFYAPGRIIRTSDGKQHKFLGIHELTDVIKKDGAVLILVPSEFRKELIDPAPLAAEIIDDNTEFIIARVTMKQ